MYLTSLLFFFNFITAVVYCSYFFGIYIGQGNSIFPSKTILTLLLFIFGLVNYLVFVKDDKYKVLKEEFEKHRRLKSSFGTFVAVLYIVLTFALLISLIWLKTAKT